MSDPSSSNPGPAARRFRRGGGTPGPARRGHVDDGADRRRRDPPSRGGPRDVHRSTPGSSVPSSPSGDGSNQAGPAADARFVSRSRPSSRCSADADGPLAVRDETWAWALSLRSADGHLGHLVVAADRQPTGPELALLREVAHETGIALMNARTHALERAAVTQLLAVNTALTESVAALERSNAIHHRLARAAFEGGGQQRIADTLHELTGHPVAIEDAYGNLRAWGGPSRPSAYPKDPPRRRAELLRRMERSEHPLRDGDRLVAVSGQGDSCGVLALCDGGVAGPEDVIALEHAARVLEIELVRLQEAVADDSRQRRDLLEELLTRRQRRTRPGERAGSRVRPRADPPCARRGRRSPTRRRRRRGPAPGSGPSSAHHRNGEPARQPRLGGRRAGPRGRSARRGVGALPLRGGARGPRGPLPGRGRRSLHPHGRLPTFLPPGPVGDPDPGGDGCGPSSRRLREPGGLPALQRAEPTSERSRTSS